MSCLTCSHRKLACDELRPRCAPCRRSHLKCQYDPSTISFQIQNETESVKARSSGSSPHKRQKTVAPAEPRKNSGETEGCASKTPVAEEPQHRGEAVDPLWSTGEQTTFWNVGMPWGDDFVGGYPPGPLGSSQFWQGIVDASLDSGFLLNDDFESIEPSRPVGSELVVETGMDSLLDISASSQAEGEQLENIPDHLLAQYYTRTLTALYSSKDRGWNYYTYFYNRFTTTHPFVLSALYSWTSAHLFFSGTLKSLEHAIKYYERCLNQISLSHNIRLASSPDGSSEFNGFPGEVQLSGGDLDAIIISLYFLASTDLLAARPRELRRLLRMTTALVTLQKTRDPKGGLSFEIFNWFCFLDVRASAFGMGSSSMITALGGEEGLVNATKLSRGFLRNEYKMLYPADMIERDKAHMPLNEIVLRLIAIFGEISRHFDEADEDIRGRVRVSLDNVRATLQSIDEFGSKKNGVLSTLLTTRAMFHAVEIYYSRSFLPRAPLYTADVHAKAIILTTDKLYKLLKIPTTDPPPTKFWPIPLVMASIEANDPIYRDWALRRIVDYKYSGEVYPRSVKFVQQVHRLEEECGVRRHLGEVMKGLAEQFVL